MDHLFCWTSEVRVALIPIDRCLKLIEFSHMAPSRINDKADKTHRSWKLRIQKRKKKKRKKPKKEVRISKKKDRRVEKKRKEETKTSKVKLYRDCS